MGVERKRGEEGGGGGVNKCKAVRWLRCVQRKGGKGKPRGIEAAQVEAGAEDCGSSLLFAHTP